MSSIDERIVSMQFDNNEFEKNVGTTLKSLANLEKSVDGLNGVSTAGLADAIESLQDRFSNLGIIGMTVLQNLTNRFVDAGVKMAKSLTIDQVAAGFEKYTANTKTVKALLNSTGEDIDTVTEKISSLSWYSDATSYSYNAMVSALKSFTAQDIKMDEAIPAIMGIGNSLSYAGLAAEEASYAFELYSKAMGQGYLGNIQWKSLNNMGAATANLKQQYIDAAVAVGTLKKVSDGLYKTQQGLTVSIRDFDMTLGHQKGKWLTREVMMRVFADVYGDYTKRLQEFMAQEENSGLTVDQAIKKFNELNGITEDFGLKAFKSAQEARTFAEAVGAVRDAASSAWRGIFENVFGNADEATEMWTSFSDWLYDVFMGPSEMMFNLTTEWKRLGGRDQMLQGFANLADALSSLTTPITRAFNAIFGVATGSKLGQILKDITDKFVDFTAKLKISDETAGKLIKIFFGLFSAIKIVKDVLGEIADAFGIVFEHVKPLAGKFLDAAAAFGEWLAKNRDFLGMKEDLLTGFAELIGRFIDFAANAKPIEWIFTNLKNVVSKLWEKLKEVGEQLKNTFTPIVDKNLNFENILKLIATLGGAQYIKLTVFDRLKELGTLPANIFGKNGALATGIKAFADSMKEWGLVDVSAEQMKNIAMSLLIMAGAMYVLASIDTEKLMGSMAGMTVAVKLMEDVLQKMSILPGGLKNTGRFAETGLAMVEIAGSMILMAEAMKIIGELDLNQIIKGIVGLGAVMLEMSLFIKSMKGIHVNADGAFALVLIAGAMLIMAKGVEKLGELPVETLKQGLLAIAGILAEIAVYSRLLKPEGLLESAFAMAVMGAAILIMAKGIDMMGSMPFETVLNGLVGIAAGLTVLGVALKLIPSNLGAAASIAVLSMAMIPLAAAFKILGTMSLGQIAVGLAAIIPTLASAFVLFKFLNPVSTIAIAAALAIFAASLNLLIPPFLAFGKMELGDIGTALLAIGGALGIFGIMALVLSEAILPMLGLAAAMALFGVGVAAFAAGMATLAASGVAATAAFIGSVELWLTAIPMMSTSIVKAFTALLNALAAAVTAAIPTLLETLGSAIEALLDFLLVKMPEFTIKGAEVVIAFLDGLTSKMPEMVESAINFIAVFITSMATSLKTHKEELITGIDELILNIFDIVWGAIKGLLKGISDRIPEVFKKGVELIGGFLRGIAEKGAEINEKMWEIIDKAGEAIAKKWDEVKQWGADIWNKIKEGFKNAIDNLTTGVKSIGKSILDGLGLGLDDSISLKSLLSKAGSVATSILSKFKNVLGIASPSHQTEILAGFLMDGFVVGIDKTSFRAEDEAAECADRILEAFGDPLAEMVAKLEEEVDMNPEITPVINLEEFDQGLSEMGMGMTMVQEYMTNLGTTHATEDWNKAYEEWKKNRDDYLSQFGAEAANLKKSTYGLTYDLAFGTSDDRTQVVFGASTIDMVAAAAHGLLTEEAREQWNKYATDEQKARYNYQVTYIQNNNSPKNLDNDTIYRQTSKQLKDISLQMTGSGAGSPIANRTSPMTPSTGKVVLDS